MESARAVGLGLLVEEYRERIVATWRRAVTLELKREDPALGFAISLFLRELAVGLRGQALGVGRERCATAGVLIRSVAHPAQLAREFKLLRRSLWDVLRVNKRVVLPEERRSADAWLDESLAEALERLERLRLRVDRLPFVTSGVTPGLPAPPRRQARGPGPPPLPLNRARTPPPIPRPVNGRLH
jgi:hypothetical protein